MALPVAKRIAFAISDEDEDSPLAATGELLCSEEAG
jgi:hypothetical protein